ncbi:MAG: hypothetical protein H7Z38_23500 [Rubrivivax sp.]|nr:hypothetical protein [Pyrinomonadaceae bacterium]
MKSTKKPRPKSTPAKPKKPSRKEVTRQRVAVIITDPDAPAFEPPIYLVGDTIIFKYEGNLRARVEGYEVVDGKTWLDARAFLGFKVPFSLVVGVERAEVEDKEGASL